MKKIVKQPLFLLALIAAVVGFTYRVLPRTFFQQDEWSAFGQTIALSGSLWQMILGRVFLPTGGTVHFAPLTALFSVIEYLVFDLRFSSYAVTSMALHVANSFLVFWLAWLLFKDQSRAFIAAIIFAADSLAHQAVSWVATAINTQGASLFVLLSLIGLLKKRPWLSMAAFGLALGFKETSAFLFVFLPCLSLVVFNRRQDFAWKKILPPWLLLALFYFALRLWLLFNTTAPLTESADLTQPSRLTYLFRLMLLPIRIIPQSFIAARQIIAWSQGLVRRVYPHYLVTRGVPDPFVVESIAFDLVCFLLLLLFLLVAWRYFKQAKIFWLAAGLMVLSGLPLIFIPGRAGYVSMIEPRHLYLSLIGSSLITAMFLARLKSKLLIIPVLFLIMFSHYRLIQRDLDSLIANSRLRESVLTQIKTEHPDLPAKVVFYTESDTAYYGLGPEEKILPFQSGLGQTLLVWFYDAEKFPPCFYEDVFLYKIESQGYRECQGRGFGYFRKYDDLLMTLQQKHLPAESVIAYRFSSQDNSLVDTSQEVWHELKASSFAAGL